MPICYVVPGLLGTRLINDGGPLGNELWLSYTRLAFCQMARMKLAANGIDPDPDEGGLCVAGQVLEGWYEVLTRTLRDGLEPLGYRVIHHGYDWRAEIRGQGALLAYRIRSQVSPADPCALVCHSLGGLVARAAWVHLGTTGQQSLVRRIITMGTPHKGTYAGPLFWAIDDVRLAGFAYIKSILGTLAQIGSDPLRPPITTPRDVANLTATWPSMYQVLPQLDAASVAADPFRPAIYERSAWPPWFQLSRVHASMAKTDWQEWIASPASVPPTSILTLVGGHGSETPLTLPRPGLLGERRAFDFTTEGDGIVTVSSALGIPAKRFQGPGSHHDLQHASWVLESIVGWVLEERPNVNPPPAPEALTGVTLTFMGSPPWPLSGSFAADC